MYNVHQLNVFVNAAQCLNFTAAARNLHMTQSSVSQHIKSLETQLDTALFVRMGRNLELTDAGRYFLPLAREIVQDVQRAQEKMQMLKERIYGQLIIGCNTAPGKYILPLMLTEFHKQHPLVEISCTVVPAKMMLDQLNAGEIHFALMNTEEQNKIQADFQLYIREPITLVVPLNHPWARRKRVQPNELFEEKFIMREPAAGSYKSVQKSLGSLGVDISKLPTSLVMGTSEAVALAVAQNLGIGFVARTIVDKICAGRVACVEVDGLGIFQDILIARQTREPSTPAQVAFWDFIRSRDGEQFHDVDWISPLVPAAA